MKIILSLMVILMPMLIAAQSLNQKTFDEKKNNEMLVGYCTREGFKMIRSNFDSAYHAEYPVYKPDAATMEILKAKLKKVKVTLVMGTWCGDSRDWVPRFFKVMDEAGYDYSKFTMICVDHVKKAPVNGLDKLKIDRVPTFIFYKRKKELGRIVEVPADLIEKDMLKILGKL